MPVISELYFYPVKSLGGIKIERAELTDRGFQYDRRWMLVDANNRFLTQREHPKMALLQALVETNGISVYKKNDPAENVLIPFVPVNNERLPVQVWDDSCEAVIVSDALNEWFSKALDMACRLVYMPDDSLRRIDARYAKNEDDVTSFSDAYPVLMISEESLQDLNNRIPGSLPVNRFRPNIVIKGCTAYEEDTMQHFTIKGINFYGVKLCARCVLTTIDQDTAVKNKEPLKTLYTYRMRNNNVYFGQNVLYHGKGSIGVGDEINIVQRKESLVFETRN